MGFKRKLFPKGKAKASSEGSRSSEIDLRKEFDDIVFGSSSSIPHGRTLLLRRMRRDEKNKPIPCACVDEITKEPDTEGSCHFCLGEGYYWDEDWVTGYAVYVGADGGQANRIRNVSPGSIRADHRIFYLRYDTEITYRDKIVELKLDTEGDPVVPYVRESIYKPQTIVRYRSDRGRVEYLAIYCNENDAIRVDE